MLVCNGCGLSLSENATFCPTCGTRVPGGQASGNPTPAPADTYYRAQAPPGPAAIHSQGVFRDPAVAFPTGGTAPRDGALGSRSIRRTLIAAGVAIVLIMVCALAMSQIRAMNASRNAFRPPFYATQTQADYFMKVGFIDGDHTTLSRWNKTSLVVSLSGSYTQQDVQTVDDALDSMEEAMGSPQLVRRQGDSDIQISYVTHDAMLKVAEANSPGCCATRTLAHNMVSAHIYIDTDPSVAHYRDGTVCHELGHSLGLADTYDATYAAGMMFGTVTDVQGFSDLDFVALRILYDPKLSSGQTRAEAQTTVQSFVR